MAGKKKLKDEYKDPNVLQKTNKSDGSTMEAIKEYLGSLHGVIRALLPTSSGKP